MKKKSTIVVLALLFCFPLLSQEVEEHTFDSITTSLTVKEKEVLIDQDVVFRYGKERKGLYYLPDISMAKKIEDRFNKLEPDVTVEAIFRIPYPEDLLEGQDRDIILYNIVREVSKISGVKYYSKRKEKYRILFDDVYAVNEKKKRIDDPVIFSNIPEYDSFPIHMKEVNLGRDYYIAEYSYDSRNMLFTLTNTSNMSFILNVVKKENMQIDLLLIPLDNEILIYGYCGVKLENPDFVRKIMDPYSSFFRRILAMETYIYNSLYGTDNLPLILKNPQG